MRDPSLRRSPGKRRKNRERGLPYVHGGILLFDGQTGVPLAMMDPVEITVQRTAAATAVAAKYLARPASRVATICGTGTPGRVSDSEVFIFDSTGTALQDVAAAALAYERAVEAGAGSSFALGS